MRPQVQQQVQQYAQQQAQQQVQQQAQHDILQRLTDQERILWAMICPSLRNGRPWDLLHAMTCLVFCDEIASNDEVVASMRKTLLPAVMIHDIGWSLVTERIRENHNSKSSRLAHMKAGAEYAKDLLARAGYTPKEISEITMMISEHDNKYLERGFKNKSTRYLYEIDSLWRLTKTSIAESSARKHTGYEEEINATISWLDTTNAIATLCGKRIAKELLDATRYADQQVTHRTGMKA